MSAQPPPARRSWRKTTPGPTRRPWPPLGTAPCLWRSSSRSHATSRCRSWVSGGAPAVPGGGQEARPFLLQLAFGTGRELPLRKTCLMQAGRGGWAGQGPTASGGGSLLAVPVLQALMGHSGGVGLSGLGDAFRFQKKLSPVYLPPQGTSTGTFCTCMRETVPSSGGTRRWSRLPLLPTWTHSSGPGSPATLSNLLSR